MEVYPIGANSSAQLKAHNVRVVRFIDDIVICNTNEIITMSREEFDELKGTNPTKDTLPGGKSGTSAALLEKMVVSGTYNSLHPGKVAFINREYESASELLFPQNTTSSQR